MGYFVSRVVAPMQNRYSGKALLLVISLLLISACEPMGPIPGGELSGTVISHPPSWTTLNETEVVQFEVNGPYSINIWGVGTNKGYYVAAAKGDEAKWTRKIAENSAVRLRIGDNIYKLNATRVDDADEIQDVLKVYKTKYELEAGEDFPDAILYRLDPR